jgi:hypothetical protein
MNANPLEKVIEAKVCDYAKKLGCLVYKFTSPARRSVPDRLFIKPDGKGVFFIEFKRKGQKPTPAQEVEIAKIRKQGTTVHVVDDIGVGKTVVEVTVQNSIPVCMVAGENLSEY